MPSTHIRLVFATVAVCVSACSSLSGQVKSDSVDYGTAMSQFLNEQLMTNIVRASENEPLHFSELGQINGSLQEQIQVGVTIPFGKYTGLSKSADQLSPQLTFASSPTFTTSPLDTEAFTVGLMQPIDATYLVNRLTTADEPTRQLLLLLFVESINNADGENVPPMFKGAARLKNTVDNPAFRTYVGSVLSQAEFREVTVLTPLGSEFAFDPKAMTGYKLTDLVPLADEVTVHLAKTKEMAGSTPAQYQLFHIWSNQLALCYQPPPVFAGFSFANPVAPAKPVDSGIALYLDALRKDGTKAGAQSGGTSAAATPAAKGGAGGGGGGASPTVATPLMPLVGFVANDQCSAPIYVEGKVQEVPAKDAKPNKPEREFQINLRSVRGAIEYLGTLVGNAALVGQNSILRTADGRTVLFSMTKETADDPNKDKDILTVDRGKVRYALRDAYSAKTIQILSELVDSLKLSSDIATTKQVQIIP